MADDADIASSYIDKAVADTLSRMQSSMPQSGSKTCVECEESIPEARRKLGFRLCIECAAESERRGSLFAK